MSKNVVTARQKMGSPKVEPTAGLYELFGMFDERLDVNHRKTDSRRLLRMHSRHEVHKKNLHA